VKPGASGSVDRWVGSAPRAHGRMTEGDGRGNDQKRRLHISGAYERIGASGSVNRWPSLAVFEHSTCRDQRKCPVSWVFPASWAVFVVSHCGS
jgi:hypothetical protein